MDIRIFKGFTRELIKYSDFVDNYDIYVNTFLDEFQDNTETLFLENQISDFMDHKNELSEFIKGIDFVSEDRDEYLQILRNRILPFSFYDHNDNNDRFDIVFSEDYNEYSYCMNYLKNKKATVCKILDFLNEELNKTKPENPKSNTSSSNDLKEEKDETKMAWFIVGLNIANGEIHKMRNEGLSNGSIAECLGLKKSDGPHVSKSFSEQACKGEKSRNNVFNYPRKILKIYNYCNNNEIFITQKFTEIALNTFKDTL